MLHVITCNDPGIRSIREYNNNFIISHLTEIQAIPCIAGKTMYQFKIYHQDGMELSDYEDYISDQDMEYEFIPVSTMTEAFDRISQDIIRSEQDAREEAERDDESPEELFVACVCGVRWNYQVVRYINGKINEAKGETTCLDIYRHYKIAKMERLVDILKDYLQTEYIYPEDPVAFGYALFRMIDGALA